MGLDLKFLINYQHKGFKQGEKEEEKISGFISLHMKDTIPGTPGSKKTKCKKTCCHIAMH